MCGNRLLANTAVLVPWLKWQGHLGEKWPGLREHILGLILQIPTRPRPLRKLTSGEPACPPWPPLHLHSILFSPLLLLGATLASHWISRSYSSEGGQLKRVKLDTRTSEARDTTNEVKGTRGELLSQQQTGLPILKTVF